MRQLLIVGMLAGLLLHPELGLAQSAPSPGAPRDSPLLAPPASGASPQSPAPSGAPLPNPTNAPAPITAPSGAVYPAAGEGAPPDSARELSALDARIAVLRAERSQHRVAGPIVMMSVGYSVGVLFTAVALSEWNVAHEIERGNTNFRDSYDLNDDGVVDGDDERRARRVARGSVFVGALGLALAITGTVLFVDRNKARRANDPELNNLTQRRSQLLQQIRYAPNVTYGGAGFALSGRF